MPPGLRPDPRWAAMAEAPQSQQAQQPQQNRRGSLPMQGQGPMQQQQWIGGFPPAQDSHRFQDDIRTTARRNRDR